MRRTYKYAAMTEDAAPVCVQGTGRERRRWTFYEAVIFTFNGTLYIRKLVTKDELADFISHYKKTVTPCQVFFVIPFPLTHQRLYLMLLSCKR